MAAVHEAEMAYVGKDIKISEDYGGELIIHNKPPIREILLAIMLLTLGVVGIAGGTALMVTQSGTEQARGVMYFVLGALLFLPGFYESRIAYYAYKGYQGFSFANIPTV